MAAVHNFQVVAAVDASFRLVLFWILAAMSATTAHLMLSESRAAALVSMTMVVLAAFCYMRFGSASATVDHALTTGITWFALSIVAEMIASAALGRLWPQILGSPEHPVFRMMSYCVWMFSPALFVRRN